MSTTALDPQNQYSAASAPSSPKVGDTYFNTVFNALLIYNGSAWEVMPPASFAAISSPSTIYLTASSPTVINITSTVTTVVLPDVTTLPSTGYKFTIVNTSYFNSIAINSSGGTRILNIPVGAVATLVCAALTGTSNTSWVGYFEGTAGVTGSGYGVLQSSPTIIAAAANYTALTIRGFSGQTGDLLELQSSSGSVIYSLTASGVPLVTQPVPSAINATATLTIANLLTLIVTCTNSGAVTYTLPTGTLMDGGFAYNFINESFEWSVINTASSTNAITLAAGAAHTIVGSSTVAIGTSALFRSVRTAAATWVTYRIV